MADQQYSDHATYGIFGGIITVLMANINAGDIIKTAVLAVVGTVVSLIVSIAYKYWLGRWRKK